MTVRASSARVAVGEVMQESNSFAKRGADLGYFEGHTLATGDDVLKLTSAQTSLAGVMNTLARAGHTIIPTIAAQSPSSGPVQRQAYDFLKSECLDHLSAAAALDAVVLSLHGAMATEDLDDAEGDLLAAVRATVGDDVPIAIALDMHANMTEEMIRHANIVVGYETYPHVDLLETGQRVAELLLGTLKGVIAPQTIFAKAPMIVPAEAMDTSVDPMARLLAQATRCRSLPGVVSTSLFAVQPWLDMPGTGMTTLAVVDLNESGDALDEVRSAILDLARSGWDLRHEFDAAAIDLDLAIDHALVASGGPFVISDSADGPMAGSAGDSTTVLRRLMERHVDRRTFVCVVDQEAVDRCFDAGVGSAVALSVGANVDPRWSEPTAFSGVVRTLSSGRFQLSTAKGRGLEVSMGRATVVDSGTIALLISERPADTADPSMYTSVGLDPRQADIVVVKSARQFRAGYAHLASGMCVVSLPGASTSDLRSLPWRRRTRPLYPFEDRSDPELRICLGRTP